MTVLTWYVVGKLKLFHNPCKGRFVLSALSLIPIGIATFIAVSRTVDHVHDFSDINAGAFIGIASGTFAYFLNYSSPFAATCREPKDRSYSEYKKKLAEKGATCELAQRQQNPTPMADEQPSAGLLTKAETTE